MRTLPLPAELTGASGAFLLRDAVESDLDAVLVLLADDPLSTARGDFVAADRPAQLAALREIGDDPSNAVLVVADGAEIVGTMQLTRLPGLARGGAARLQVEAVRVRSDRRSSGIGGLMMRWVMDIAADATGAAQVQLTSDASRTDAHRFYRQLGFVDSHVGFKYRTS